MIIFPHDVGHNGNHAEIGKAVFDEVRNAIGVERLNRGHSHPGDVAELNAIFNVDCSDAARFEGAQQLRRQIVHLFKKCVVVGVMAEIVVRWAVLVMIAKGDAGYIQVDAVGGPVFDFFDAVVVDGGIAFPCDFHSLTSYRSFEGFKCKAAKAVLLDDLFHFSTQFVVLMPLALQGKQDFTFGVHVQDVDYNRLVLQKAVDSMHGLNEIIKFIVDAHKNRPVTKTLEIAAGAGQALFCAEQPGVALCKIHYALFAGFKLHAAVDVHHLRDGLFQSFALIFEVMPDDKVFIRAFVDDGGALGGSDLDAVALFPCSVGQAHCGIMAQLHLAVRVKFVWPLDAGQLVIADVHRR